MTLDHGVEPAGTATRTTLAVDGPAPVVRHTFHSLASRWAAWCGAASNRNCVRFRDQFELHFMIGRFGARGVRFNC